MNLNDSLDANSLDYPAQNPVIAVSFDLLEIGGNDLKLQAGTTRIQD
jgi:hypothetical protein